MPTIAISGAGSGIGHTFLHEFASEPSNIIHAIDVTFHEEVNNKKFAAKITRHECNTSSPDSVQELSSAIGSDPIDLFIHSAAVRGLEPSATKKSDNPSDAETMEVLNADTFTKTLQVNILGSFLLIRALLPNLKASKNQPAKCIVMSSRMGSIASNKDGGAYAYRASKAGLNALVKSFSIDVPEVCFVVMHPGRVESRMTHVREEGAVDAPDAVKEMMPVIEKFSKKDSGRFVLKDGSEIPW
jgi:NAD(P)-dependent dehydrogenase (short-subunit alcohol dehydrogenase family)